MRASLDTNVIIHLYRAGIQSVLFDIFDEEELKSIIEDKSIENLFKRYGIGQEEEHFW